METGEALLAITPSETIVSFHLRPLTQPKPALKAVATLLQKDDSAIVTLKSSGIDRPSKLDGKRYASYAARFEGRIVQKMLQADGGCGDYQELALPMLGVWNTLLQNEADATWVFMGWEGVEAALKGIELNVFKLEDYGVAYGYSPVVVAHPDTVEHRQEELRKVLAATAEGYAYAAAHPAEAAELMLKLVNEEFFDLPVPLDAAVLKGSVAHVATLLLNTDGRWGVMEQSRWDAFLDWLSENQLLTTHVQSRNSSSDKSAGTTSLDGLRGGDAGDVIPRDSVHATAMFTNAFLL